MKKNNLIEEDLAADNDIVQMYNEFNKRYFNNSLPTGVTYKKSNEDSYGKYKTDKVGIGYSNTGKSIGDAWSYGNYEADKMDVQKIRISKKFNFVDYDIATASDGGGTLMGILLHEMCHFAVTLDSNSIAQYRARKDREGPHGSTFVHFTLQVQKELDSNGVNIKVPAEESAAMSYNQSSIPQLAIINYTTWNGRSGYSVMTYKSYLKKRDELIKYYGSDDIIIYQTTEPKILDYKKSVKLPFGGMYPETSEVKEILDSSLTKKIETISSKRGTIEGFDSVTTLDDILKNDPLGLLS